MKKFLIACLIALGCMTATAAPSLAQSGPMFNSERGYHQDRYDRGDRYERRGDRWHGPRRHFGRERCRTRTVKFRHHGRWIVEKRTVCRR